MAVTPGKGSENISGKHSTHITSSQVKLFDNKIGDTISLGGLLNRLEVLVGSTKELP